MKCLVCFFFFLLFIYIFLNKLFYSFVFPIWKKGSIASEPLFGAVASGAPVILVDALTKEGMSGAPVLYFGSDVLGDALSTRPRRFRHVVDGHRRPVAREDGRNSGSDPILATGTGDAGHADHLPTVHREVHAEDRTPGDVLHDDHLGAVLAGIGVGLVVLLHLAAHEKAGD